MGFRKAFTVKFLSCVVSLGFLVASCGGGGDDRADGGQEDGGVGTSDPALTPGGDGMNPKIGEDPDGGSPLGDSAVAPASDAKDGTLPSENFWPLLIPGSRLRPLMLQPKSGGAPQFQNAWFDKQLGIKCRFSSDGQGALRCFPAAMWGRKASSTATCSQNDLVRVDPSECPVFSEEST